MREFILEDGSLLVLHEEVDLIDITVVSDPRRRLLAVPLVSPTQVSPSSPPQADLSDPAGPGARAGFFSE